MFPSPQEERRVEGGAGKNMERGGEEIGLFVPMTRQSKADCSSYLRQKTGRPLSIDLAPLRLLLLPGAKEEVWRVVGQPWPITLLTAKGTGGSRGPGCQTSGE